MFVPVEATADIEGKEERAVDSVKEGRELCSMTMANDEVSGPADRMDP